MLSQLGKAVVIWCKQPVGAAKIWTEQPPVASVPDSNVNSEKAETLFPQVVDNTLVIDGTIFKQFY